MSTILTKHLVTLGRLTTCDCVAIHNFRLQIHSVQLPKLRRHEESKMYGWHIHSYGGLEELQMSDSTRIPKIRSPDDVLVEVLSSSVNPIDVAMMGGYGSVLLNAWRQLEACALSILEFPLTLGRDFSGYVVGKGFGVSHLNLGDEVWGVIPPQQQGSHADRVIVNKSLVQKKPANLNHNEAGSLLYTAVTAWSSLKITGDLSVLPAQGKRVLLLGGSGGVGTMAIQLLKAWGAQVVTTCRTDAVPLLESLGADSVIDYTHPDCGKLIEEGGKYDIILDAAALGSDKGPEYAKYLKDFKLSKYITLTSPLLRNVDKYGCVGGMVKNFVDLVVPNLKTSAVSASSTVRWGFFIPTPEALKEIAQLVEGGKVVPMIEKVYDFCDLPCAYEHVLNGHLRGKVVIDISNKNKSKADTSG